jgi:hypothetical protein
MRLPQEGWRITAQFSDSDLVRFKDGGMRARSSGLVTVCIVGVSYCRIFGVNIQELQLIILKEAHRLSIQSAWVARTNESRLFRKGHFVAEDESAVGIAFRRCILYEGLAKLALPMVPFGSGSIPYCSNRALSPN